MSQADQERLLLSEPALNAFIVAEMRHFLTSALEENEKPHNKKRKWKLSTKEKIDLQLITDPKTVAAAGEEEDDDDENNNVVHHHHQVIINEEYAKAKKSMTVPADALPLQKPEVALPLRSLLRHTGFWGGSPSAWPPLCSRHVQPSS